MPLFWASRFWQCHRLCSPMGRQAHPRQSRAPQRQAVSCTEIRASQIPHPFFPVFEFSLLAGRSGLRDKAGVLSLPSALRQQAWMLAELLPDLCQALLIQNSSSWIEGSSCYINSGEGGEASVFKGVERHTGNHLILELLLALTLLLYGGRVRGECHFSAWTWRCECCCFWGLVLQLHLTCSHVSEVTLDLLLGLLPGIYLLS